MLYNPKKIEELVLEYWEKNKIPEKIVEFKKENKFYLLDGPPYVNDKPHVGHVRIATFKDIWGKFKKMQGFNVWFQPGFDCGGLPIENKVEKKLNIKEKSDILKIGVDKFIEECNKFAVGNEELWINLYKKLGTWRAYLKPYLTSENYYKESGWWAIKKIYEKKLLIKGERPNFWCPRCETVLSGYEVTDAYKDILSPSVFVKFKIKNKNEFLLAWTTTPWTLPANVALCVHPDEKYVKVDVEGEIIILAKKRLEILDELNKKYELLEEFEGKKLDGIKYEPLLDIPLQKELENKNAHRVVMSIKIIKKRVASKVKTKKKIEDEEEVGHLVDISSGTGIIHIAPGHGLEDFKLGEYYNLPSPSPVDEKGRLDKTTGIFYGKKVEDVNCEIINYLKDKNLLFHNTTIIHSYPLCWRCKTPLIYRKSTQWLLKLEPIRDKILKEIETVKWLPNYIKDQFKDIVKNAPDWAITRQRFWGIPLPVWICKKCNKIKIIGSRKELKENSVEEIGEDFDILTSVVDKIHLKCDCGGIMEREKSILDVWFDSGIAPFASLGYPFKNRDLFECLYPVDLVDEGQDQIRGWFYTLMICGVALFDKAPYKTVCSSGWTLDEKGEKMSKSVGNVIWGEDAYNVLGADLLRLYLSQSNAPWETRNFSIKEAKILQNKLNILWNLVSFIEAYSERKINFCTDFEVNDICDKWLVSRINSLIGEVTEDYENFRFHYASRKILDFVIDDFSRIYIKLIRDKINNNRLKLMTYVLERILKLIAPITPFIADFIYRKFSNNSVHLSDWPKVEKDRVDKNLENKMNLAQEIVSAINSERQKYGIRLRLPIKKAYIYGLKDIEKDVEEVQEIIKILSNLMDIEFMVSKDIIIKPNFARIGKKYGKKTQEVADIISKLKLEDIKDKFKVGDFELEREDIIIKPIKGATFSWGYVTLDLSEDEELKKERFLRELIREIQKARKEESLEVLDNIILFLEDKNFIRDFEEKLRKEVRASKIVYELKNEKGFAVYKDLSLKFGFKKVDDELYS